MMRKFFIPICLIIFKHALYICMLIEALASSKYKYGGFLSFHDVKGLTQILRLFHSMSG